MREDPMPEVTFSPSWKADPSGWLLRFAD
jgi:hypothetical protein